MTASTSVTKDRNLLKVIRIS